jgi:hypothetical protein
MIKRRKERASWIYFVFNGSVEFLLGKDEKEIGYRNLYRGCIFGLEDYLYRIPEEELFELYDGKSFFCDHEIKKTQKNKFYVRYVRDLLEHDEVKHSSDKANYQLMKIKFTDVIEMQTLFEEIANDFFVSQMQ